MLKARLKRSGSWRTPMGWRTSGPRHLDLSRLVVLGARQGQGHDAALELGGGFVGVDPEGQDDGAREGAVRPLLPLHDGTVVDRLGRTDYPHGDGVAPNRDVEVVRR